jgi:hypothetical protein
MRELTLWWDYGKNPNPVFSQSFPVLSDPGTDLRPKRVAVSCWQEFLRMIWADALPQSGPHGPVRVYRFLSIFNFEILWSLYGRKVSFVIANSGLPVRMHGRNGGKTGFPSGGKNGTGSSFQV